MIQLQDQDFLRVQKCMIHSMWIGGILLDSTPVYTNSIKDDCEDDKYFREKYCFAWSREDYCNHRIFKGKVIIHKSRGEVSLVMQDTIEYSLFNSFFYLHFMQLFSAIFKKKRKEKLPMTTWKKPISKALHNRTIFFSVLPTGPKPAQISIYVS